MKIEKLYTLSQFIDLQKDSEFNPNEGYSYDEFTSERLGLIFRYNEFLKQEVTSEMLFHDKAILDSSCKIFLRQIEKTLCDLAEASAGTLNLKNVNL